MKLPRIFAPIFLLIPLQLLAAQTDAPDCSAPTTQVDMNRCAYEDFLAANGAQAAVLKGLTQALATPDRQRLRTAQKAWIAWRTAQCEFETGGSSGGSARELARWSCTEKLTRERTVALAFGIQPAQLIKKLGVGGVLVRPLYRNVKEDAELGRQVVRDAIFTAFARRIAVLHAANAPVWRYYFSRVPDGLRGKQPGVPHGGEVAPVFGTADLCACTGVTPTDGDRAAAQAVASRWVGFARDGRPDVTGLPAWPADAKFKNVLLEFGEKQVVRPAFMRQRLNTFIAAGNLLAS